MYFLFDTCFVIFNFTMLKSSFLFKQKRGDGVGGPIDFVLLFLLNE